MRARVVMAVLLTFLCGGAAEARTFCNLLRQTDEAAVGGPDWQESVLPGSTAGHRLKNGDLATNARTLTAVIRLYADASTNPTAAVQSQQFGFAFSTSPEHHYLLEAHVGQTKRFTLLAKTMRYYAPDEMPSESVWQDEMTYLRDVTGIVDTKRNEVRIHVPLSALKGLRSGSVLRHFGASVNVKYGDGEYFVGVHSDAISGYQGSYPLGARSCVSVGR